MNRSHYDHVELTMKKTTVKKLRRVGLIFGYILSAVIITFGTYFLVLLARGNSFDIFTGKLKPTGLLLVDSIPPGAQFEINHKLSKQKTPLRITNIEPGAIDITLSKDGYRNWRNRNSITAGQVTFLTYAWLVPNSLQHIDLLSSLNITATTQTIDHKHAALITSKPQLSVYASDDFVKASQVYRPPTATDPAQTISALTVTSLSDDGGAALVQQTNSVSSEYIAVDMHGNRAEINLTQELRLNGSPVGYNPDNNQQIIWFDNGTLRVVDLSSRTIGAVFASDVTYATISRAKLYFIQTKVATSQTTASPTHNLYSADLGGSDQKLVLARVEDSPTYQLKVSSFGGSDYLALLVGKSRRFNLYLLNNGTQNQTGDVLENVSAFSFNRTGQFLAIVQNNRLLCYDIEKKVYHNTGSQVSDLMSWQWLDNFHLGLATPKGVYLSDFDGQNYQLLQNWVAISNLAVYKNNPIVLHPEHDKNNLSQLTVIEKH